MSTLTINTKKTSKGFEIRLMGRLDENAQLPAILEKTEKIYIDLKEVHFINSLGIRLWLEWMESSTNPNLYFLWVPTILVDQMSLVDGFFPEGADILSFAAPYYCEECDSTSDLYYEAPFVKEDIVNNSPKCENCQAEMELDVLPSKYFRFLEASRKSA